MAPASRNDTGSAPIIVGLGESLFDVFTDRRVLGGAPLNVAVHAHQLAQVVGGCGAVVSCVGDDELGQEVLNELARRGMATEFVQADPARSTGRVNVTVREGEPDYEIEADVAWDAIGFTSEMQDLAVKCSAVCFGSLAQRNVESRQAINSFLDNADRAIRLFDVNLRQDYYDRDVIQESCRRASAVKLNEEELRIVSGLLQLGQSDDNQNELVMRLRQRFDLRVVVLTRGERGTILMTADGRFEGLPMSFPKDPDADSVGAGDACSAGLLVGWVLDWPHERTVELANLVGAYVASVPGATPELPPECLRLVRETPSENG